VGGGHALVPVAVLQENGEVAAIPEEPSVRGLGPFNTHALTGDSRTRYQVLATTMERWLEKEKIPHYAPRLLPSDMYADLSHPLGDGYREIARELFGSPSFQVWMKSWGSKADQVRRRERSTRTEQER